MALAAGVPALGTLARVEALAERSRLGVDNADRLLQAGFALLMGLQLRRQIADRQARRSTTRGRRCAPS